MLLVLGVFLVSLAMITPIQPSLPDSTYTTQGVTVTASLLTHSDGTATITVSVENTNPSTIRVSSVYIYPSADPNVSCGYGVYRACFVCIESGVSAPYGVPQGVPTCGQPIAPNGSGSWTNTLYSNLIHDGQGYQLWISINDGTPVSLGTLDATSESASGIPAFPYQPLAAVVLTALVIGAYLEARRVRPSHKLDIGRP